MKAETRTKRSELTRSKILHAAAKLFLEKGYAESTVKEIAQEAGVNLGSLTFAFKNKENILCELVGFVLEGQFEAVEKIVQGVTDDKAVLPAGKKKFYFRGEEIDVFPDKNGAYVFSLKVGDAVFVEILR